MSVYVVIREAGPKWAAGGIFEQEAIDEHAAFMNKLAADGFIHFAGPLSGTEGGRVRALLVIEAESEDEIRRRLAEDPWVPAELLRLVSIEPWKVLVGTDRLTARSAPSSIAR